MLVAGASGTMKTSLLLSLADQAIAAGNPCVFTDIKARANRPGLTSHYYRPGKDFLFNLADKRCVCWRIDREFRDPLGALALARRLIPERPNSVPYFVENSRYIVTHGFSELGLTVQEFMHSINYPERNSTGLYARLEHGPYGELMKNGEVKAFIIGNLKYALDSLSLLPTEGQEFSAYDWASRGTNRTGHVFLASSRNNWVAQQNLQGILLDLLFVNIQTFPGPGWMILDEMGIFRSEELEPALSVQRDSGVPIVLAFQSFSQLEKNHDVPTKWSILSAPETLVILKMRGKDAVDAQDLISAGVDVERIRESKSAHPLLERHQHHNYSTETATIKPVPAGVIQNKDPGHGYLVQPGRITPIRLIHRPTRMNQPGFVPREWPAYAANNPPSKGYGRSYQPKQRKLPVESPVNIT